MVLLVILLIACSTESRNPPIPPKNEFLIQDSLVENFGTYQRRIYFGYEKTTNKLAGAEWKDCINIYHIKNNSDTVYSVKIPFYRTEEEGQGCYLESNTSDTLSFILRTVAGNSAFSDNIFKYISKDNNYFFKKRIYNLKVNDNWTKFDISVRIYVNKIDSLLMQKIFKEENYISNHYE